MERNDGETFPPGDFLGRDDAGEGSRSPPRQHRKSSAAEAQGKPDATQAPWREAPSSSVLAPVTYAMLADAPGISAHFSIPPDRGAL